MAVVDFDKFNFSLKKHNEGTDMSLLRYFWSELIGKDLEGVQPLTTDYDSFNIEAFYNFCRKCPFTKKVREYAYPFVALKNVDKNDMDEYIIATWLKNHESIKTYEKELDGISVPR